jgi:hypothetical protein
VGKSQNLKIIGILLVIFENSFISKSAKIVKILQIILDFLYFLQKLLGKCV